MAAINDMQKRFTTIFGDELAARLEFRTINGISAKIIGYYGRCVGKKPFELVTDEGDKTKLLSAIYTEIVKQYPTESDLKNISTYMSKLVAIEACRISQEKANIKDSKLSIIQAIAYNEPSALVLINRLYYVGVTRAKNELCIFEFDEGLTFINELLGVENKKSTKLNNIYAGTNVSSSGNR